MVNKEKNKRKKNPTPILNIGLWGLGLHAQKNILPALQKSEFVSLKGVLTRDKKKAQQIATEHSCTTWASSEDMLSDPDLDVVFVSTPTGLHFEHGKSVLKAGKHLWMEKSLTTNYFEAKELVELSKEKNVSIFEGFMFLHHPQFKHLKYLISNPKFGKIISITCRFGLPPLETPGFRNSSSLGGGALLDTGSYTLSAVLALMESEPKIINSIINKPKNMEVDKGGMAVLLFNEEIYAFIDWGYNRSYRNEIDIWGEHASVFTDKIFSKTEDYEPTLIHRNHHGKITKEQIETSNSYVQMFNSFANGCNNKKFQTQERKQILRQSFWLDKIMNVKI